MSSRLLDRRTAARRGEARITPRQLCRPRPQRSPSRNTERSTTVLGTGFDGDKFQACLAFVDPPDCGMQFLGDYIAVSSTNDKAQILYTGNGDNAMDAFSARATF